MTATPSDIGLQAIEDERKRLEARLHKIMGIGVGAALILVVLVAILQAPPLPVYIIVLLVPCFFAWIVGVTPLQRHLKFAHREMLQKISDSRGIDYQPDIEYGPDFDEFHGLRLAPSSDRQHFRALFSGERHGIPFLLYEAHLQNRQVTTDSQGRRRTSWVTVFHGELFKIDWPTPFTGKTMVMRDKGLFNQAARPNKGLQRVGLASAHFEDAFEVWSDDQVNARTILDPVVMERFLALEKTFQGKSLRAAFYSGSLYLCVRTHTRIPRPALFKPLTTGPFVENINKGFEAIYDLIDLAVAPVQGHLGQHLTIDNVRSK